MNTSNQYEMQSPEPFFPQKNSIYLVEQQMAEQVTNLKKLIQDA